jgi:hypothetical protein
LIRAYAEIIISGISVVFCIPLVIFQVRQRKQEEAKRRITCEQYSFFSNLYNEIIAQKLYTVNEELLRLKKIRIIWIIIGFGLCAAIIVVVLFLKLFDSIIVNACLLLCSFASMCFISYYTLRLSKQEAIKSQREFDIINANITHLKKT